jgi:S1-C subfamily serine protease
MTLILLLLTGACAQENGQEKRPKKQDAIPPQQQAQEKISRVISREIADAVEDAMPSVVVVRTEAIQYEIAQDAWRRLYRIPRRLAGLGSGVIISEDGYVITCEHVVRNAENVEIVLYDGTIYEAERVASDPAADLAVLKIQCEEQAFQPIEPADSDKVRIGEFVIAIGSPFSLASSVTVGVVSQKGRSIGLLPYEDFIQTDASINPGNSGGPLIDVDGRMIGINNAIKTSSPVRPGNVGIGFAVPANLAMDIAASLIDQGYYARPRIGILMGQLNPDRARRLTGRQAAVFIDTVFEGSPAEREGLKEGDIILSVDGRPVKSMREVQRAVLRHVKDRPVRMTIQRFGKKHTLSIMAERVP